MFSALPSDQGAHRDRGVAGAAKDGVVRKSSSTAALPPSISG